MVLREARRFLRSGPLLDLSAVVVLALVHSDLDRGEVTEIT
jgi:hypothetical protein